MSGASLILMAIAACGVGALIAWWGLRAQRDALRDMAAGLRDELSEQRETGLASTIDTVVAVASERLGAHTAAYSQDAEAHRALMAQQIEGMRGQLDKVGGLVADLESRRAEQYGSLARQIADAGQQTRTLADTTRGLREALSSTTSRGQWGERMAEDVLQLAGMLEGVNYHKQRRLDTGGMPDFTFLLPRGMRLHMDVKFPLSNYLRYLDADGDTDRERLRRDFLRDARQRVRELIARDYLDPDDTVDCVLLFIPNEQLYAFIQEHDPELADTALRNKVVLCSPLTLFAVLAVVRQAVDNFRLERTSDEILKLLGDFGVQWRKFTEQLDTLGGHLERSQRAFETLAATRRRQLERPLDKLEDLRQERRLPDDGTEVAGEPAALRAVGG